MWESHADSDVGRGRSPSLGQAIPIYALDDVGEAVYDLPVATVSPTEQALLESLLQRLLPTPVGSSPDVTIPSELELLLQRLLGDDWPVQPGRQESRESLKWKFYCRICFRSVHLQLSGHPRIRHVGTGQLWCVSRAAHWVMGASRCPTLDVAAGMEGREGGERLCYAFSSGAGGALSGGKRRLIWGGGSTAWVSNGTRPQDSDDGGGFCSSGDH